MEPIVTNRCTEQTPPSYGTDHSDIISEQVNINCMVHNISYRHIGWISYPVYSRYNRSILQVRCGNECDIAY
jgi:hypothetical protein